MPKLVAEKLTANEFDQLKVAGERGVTSLQERKDTILCAVWAGGLRDNMTLGGWVGLLLVYIRRYAGKMSYDHL